MSENIVDYFFEGENCQTYDKVYILIIYDIINNKKRNKLAKLLKGYGFRIQKSAFEARISAGKYRKLLKELDAFGSAEDCIRVYKIIGNGQVTTIGKPRENIDIEDVIII